MKQPKFKFGDKVIQIHHPFNSKKEFVIVEIFRSVYGTYYYSGKISETTKGVYEDDLILYQEPKKRKLFAYSFREEGIKFHTEETWIVTFRHFIPLRLPQYDIEYKDEV